MKQERFWETNHVEQNHPRDLPGKFIRPREYESFYKCQSLYMATKPKFHSQIRYSNKAPEVGRGLKSTKPYLVLEIPQKILVDWRGLKFKSPDVSYTKLIEESVELPFGLAKTPSLEKRINDAALNAVRDCHGKTGNRKIQLLQKIRQISVCRSEIIGPSLPRKDSDSEEVCDIEKRCSELYSELLEEKESARKCKEDLRNYKAEMSVLKEENTTLVDYVNNLEKLNVCHSCTDSFENKSKTVSNVGPRQRQRKLKELTTKAERALWFLESYGVTTKSLTVEDPNGQKFDLHINQGDPGPKSKYEDLEEETKEKIKEVLHIMDTFCVGDAAYHALSSIESGLPRGYLVKQCRGDINGMFRITKTPGELTGAQMSFKEELRRKLREKVESNKQTGRVLVCNEM